MLNKDSLSILWFDLDSEQLKVRDVVNVKIHKFIRICLNSFTYNISKKITLIELRFNKFKFNILINLQQNIEK